MADKSVTSLFAAAPESRLISLNFLPWRVNADGPGRPALSQWRENNFAQDRTSGYTFHEFAGAVGDRWRTGDFVGEKGSVRSVMTMPRRFFCLVGGQACVNKELV